LDNLHKQLGTLYKRALGVLKRVTFKSETQKKIVKQLLRQKHNKEITSDQLDLINEILDQNK